MKLTEEEKELILAKRKKEEPPIIKRYGYLKHDLYYLSRPYNSYGHDSLLTKDDVNYITDNMFKICVQAGYKCFSQIEDDGQELWFDDSGYIEYRGEDWAEKHLIGIHSAKSKLLTPEHIKDLLSGKIDSAKKLSNKIKKISLKGKLD